MSEPRFIIMAVDGGYIAFSNMHGSYTARSLQRFGGYLLAQVQQRSGEADVEFSISDDLRAGYAICKTCAGTASVESSGIAAQYLRNDFDAIDWTKKAA